MSNVTKVGFVIILFCLKLFFTSQVASASEQFDGFFFTSGEEIYRLCSSSDSKDIAACQNYVCGMVDGWQTEYVITGRRYFNFCLKKVLSVVR